MNHNSKDVSPKNLIKTLTILHGAFTMAPFIFSLVILIILENYTVFELNNTPIFYYAIPFVAIAIIYVGMHVFKLQLSKIKIEYPLNKKLVHYQIACIIRYAFVEGPAFLCIILTMVTEQMVFLIIAWSILVYMYTLRPTTDKVISHLKLKSEERSRLVN